MYIENKLFLIKRNLYKICGLPLILFPFGNIFSCRNRGGASEYIENLLILKPTCEMQYSYPFGVHVSISSVISLFLMCDPTTNVYIQAPVEFWQSGKGLLLLQQVGKGNASILFMQLFTFPYPLFHVQSTPVISNSKGLTETLRDIRTSTYPS